MNKINFLLVILTLSCSSMHLKVKSNYESPKGKGSVTFTKSYDLASWPWMCGASAIFLGGACWSYFMLPMVPQEELAKEDAKKALSKQLDTKEVTLLNPVVTRESWEDDPSRFELGPVIED